MPKYSPSYNEDLLSFIDDAQKAFWDTHKVVDTKFHITRSQYCEEDEYGRNHWEPPKDLYGPYEDKEEAQKHLNMLNADPNLRPRQGTLSITTRRLVETTVVKRFWI